MQQGKFSNSNNRRASRRISVGTIIFYSIYFLLIAGFVIGMIAGLGALKDWLVDYELSQSTNKSKEVYSQLFENPDWKKLYQMSGQEDTIYEGADAYNLYMQQLTSGKKLVMAKTSAGLDKSIEKYLILLEKAPIASFTLKNTAAEDAPMPQWELEGVTVSFKRNQSIRIISTPGHTVLVNGVPLDASHIVSTTSTLAEEYLTDGLHGFRQQVMYLDGLLMAPTVTVQNGSEQVPLQFDPETNTYSESFPVQEITDEIKNRAVEAAKLYARYTQISNEVMSKTELQAYFDKNSNTYKTLPTKWELWLQDNRGYRFSEPVVSEYYQYSDSLYSVRVSLTITVTRTDGTTKDYDMDTTYFFHLTGGKWLISSSTNESLQTPTTQVRINYWVGSTLRESVFVKSSASSVTLPEAPELEGKEFLGWFTKETNEKGQTVMHLAFSPSPTGVVYLPEGTVLEPMELYAQFGEAKE